MCNNWQPTQVDVEVQPAAELIELTPGATANRLQGGEIKVIALP